MREFGFYWVRAGDEWLVAEWKQGVDYHRITFTGEFGPGWAIPGDDVSEQDDNWDEVDERKLERRVAVEENDE